MNPPRIMLAAPASGGGKTLIACGTMRALARRGLEVSPFKCGPDAVDPLYHGVAAGRPSGNLDPFFTGREEMRGIVAAGGGDIAVIEAAMGFYDGFTPSSADGSAHDVSQRLECPVVLIVDCKGTALSAVPVIRGFAGFADNRIAGVILNNMPAHVFAKVRDGAEARTGLAVLGHVPRLPDLVLGSRHLGLLLPHEVGDLDAKLDALADALEETVDIDALIRLAGTAPPLEPYAHGPLPAADVRIAVADDAAFCFANRDNLDLLRRAGADIVRFSPLADDGLPEDVHGLILPGGYPELHADALEANASMRDDIRTRIAAGLPHLAEAGGFAYLHEEVEDASGAVRRAVGAFPGRASDTGRLVRFGYVELVSEADSGLLPRGTRIRGHGFSRWDAADPGDGCTAVKTDGSTYRAVHLTDRSAAGFPQLSYRSSPGFAARFADTCRRYAGRAPDRGI